MKDADILDHITALVHEEHALRSKSEHPLSDAESEARFAVLDRSGWVERAVAARIIHHDVAVLIAATGVFWTLQRTGILPA